MYENKSSNPFEVKLSFEHMFEDSLDDIIKDMQASCTSFDTWYQMLFRCATWLIPTIKINYCITYEIDNDPCLIYIGPHRRTDIRLFTTTLNSIKALAIPRTIKIKEIV